MNSVGTVLMSVEPYAHCLSSKLKGELCDCCFKRGRVLRCSKCKYMYYCGAQCQQKDWSVHKIECKGFAQNQQIFDQLDDDELIRVFIRLMIKYQLNLNTTTDSSGLKTFDTLMDNYEGLIKDISRLDAIQKCFKAVNHIMGSQFCSQFNTKQLLSFFGKMITNSVVISNYDLSQCIGSGIYLSVASIDHSCYPNSVVVFNGAVAIVQVINEFAVGDKPYICYTKPLTSKQKRQDYLLQNYFFKCQYNFLYSKDSDDQRIKCPFCQEFSLDLQDTEDNITCESCKRTIGDDYIQKAQECSSRLQSYIRLHKDKDSIGPKAIENGFELLKTCDTYLDPTNDWDFVDLLCILSDNCFHSNESDQETDRDRVGWLGSTYVANVYKKHQPKNHPSSGLLFVKIAQFVSQPEEAFHWFQQGVEILTPVCSQVEELAQTLKQIESYLKTKFT